MNERRETERLLNDVLDGAAEWRGELLAQTLRQVRRRTRVRRARSALATVALLAIVSVAVWRSRPPSSPSARMTKPDLIVIYSRPLDASMIVRTRPNSVSVVASSESTFNLVETGARKSLVREIDDEGLLALFAGKAVVLVRPGPNQAELIFLHPEDAKGFPVQ